MPPEVSSARVSIGRRRLVTSVSPIPGMMRPIATRLCSIDMNSRMSSVQNAQVSTTCWPCVLTILTVWPRRRRAALPLRAGISIMPPPWCCCLSAFGRHLDRRTVLATGHQAILHIGVLPQRVDQEIGGDDQHRDQGEPEQRRPAAVMLGLLAIAAIVLRARHRARVAAPPARDQRRRNPASAAA